MKLPCSKKRPWIVTADLPAGAVLAGLSGKLGQVTFRSPLWPRSGCASLFRTPSSGKGRSGLGSVTGCSWVEGWS